MCACTETDGEGINDTTALSPSGKDTVVAEKRCRRSTLHVPFLLRLNILYKWITVVTTCTTGVSIKGIVYFADIGHICVSVLIINDYFTKQH
jgi:hypothetical protein